MFQYNISQYFYSITNNYKNDFSTMTYIVCTVDLKLVINHNFFGHNK